MKIAVANEPGTPALGPFRKGSDLSIWEVVDGKVVSKQSVPQAGGCCGGLARSVCGVDVVLCSGIGHGAMSHLVEQGTAVARPDLEGIATVEAVELWISGAYERFFVASDDCQHQGCHPHEGEHPPERS
jgi:predicted Fe-Mo cluster-binding NifX family protein